MTHPLRPSRSRRRRPLCSTPLPHRPQAIVLVIIILLVVSMCIAVPGPAVAASAAALLQAAATLWIALHRPGPATAEG